MYGAFAEVRDGYPISLLRGVEKSAKPEHDLRQVEDFVSRLNVLEYGGKAASHHGEIRADLERKGTPIGVNDLHNVFSELADEITMP